MAAPRPDDSPRVVRSENGVASRLGNTIGHNVRGFRSDLGWTTGQLADKAGVSKAMVSKIENARTSPSLATLASLADVLEIPLTALFRGLDEEHEAVHIKKGEATEIARSGSRSQHTYEFLGASRGAYRHVEPMLITLEKESEVFPLFQHSGIEWLYMLTGAMEYGYGSAQYTLEAGDAFIFQGHVAHGPTKLVQLPIKFLSVKADPSVRTN